MSSLPLDVQYVVAIFVYMFVEMFVGWLYFRKSPTLVLLCGVGDFFLGGLYLIAHPKHLLGAAIFCASMLGVAYLISRPVETAGKIEAASPAAVVVVPMSTVEPTSTPTKYEDAGMMPVSEYTATVLSGGYIFNTPDFALTHIGAQSALEVKVVGYDYSSGWVYAQLLESRVWIHSTYVDLPDGSVVDHQLPELVK